MKFNEISKQNQEFVKEHLDKKLENVNYSDVDVSFDAQDNLQIKYKDLTFTIPVRKPDQQTSNHIWSTLAGGAIALAGVALAFFGIKYLSSDSDSDKDA